MCVITTMQLLDVPYMYASGGPSGASTTQGIFIYNAFNQDLNYGQRFCGFCDPVARDRSNDDDPECVLKKWRRSRRQRR